MKPISFDYVRARSADHAFTVLNGEPDAQLIAGGQTLVPLLNMRLARPSVLVDIGHLDELAGISVGDSALVIGATTKQLAVETNDLVRKHCPLLHKVMPWIGHRPTRARGTIGGSLAVADPAAEIPLTAVVLEATIHAHHNGKELKFAAGDFFIGGLATKLPDGACITAISLPLSPGQRTGCGFAEVSTRRSDFAIASAAVRLTFDRDNVCTQAALGIGAIAGRPRRLEEIAGRLRGQKLSEAEIDKALLGLEDSLSAQGHLHASPDYCRRAAVSLLRRALNEACLEAAAR